MLRILVFVLVGILLIQCWMNVAYNYDWIGTTVRKVLFPDHPTSTLYPIISSNVPFADRIGVFTRTPKMKQT